MTTTKEVVDNVKDAMSGIDTDSIGEAGEQVVNGMNDAATAFHMEVYAPWLIAAILVVFVLTFLKKIGKLILILIIVGILVAAAIASGLISTSFVG